MRRALLARVLAPLLAPLLALALVAAPAWAADPGAGLSPPDTWVPRTTAELVVLDKMRAVPTAVTVDKGASATVGTLTLTVRNCVVRPPDLPANAAAFLDMSENGVSVFHGWILANTPAVSQLEHPVYDVRVVACR